MKYTLSLTRRDAETLEAHLLRDREREQMAITLCGVNRMHRETRLLVRDVILLEEDAFAEQGAARLELRPDVQAHVHRRAYENGLIQVDWHSHPGRRKGVTFSGTDDRYEALQAVYLAHRMEGVPYGSVVVNDEGLDARIWLSEAAGKSGDGEVTYRPHSQPIEMVKAGDLKLRIPTSAGAGGTKNAISAAFDRQVRAFGEVFQRRMGELRVGIVGLGGLGSAFAELLSRMGVRDWVLVDPDGVELSNLNRLVGASLIDAQKGRPKVYVARSSVRQINPKASVRAIQASIFDAEARRALKACDLLVVATDDHSSRMAANRLAVQYLIPLVHAGFNISIEPDTRSITDISGEFAIPDLGNWCLQCAGIIDPQRAGWEMASDAQQAILRKRGYVTDTPAPAVRHLDSTVASLAAAEIHNLAHTYKPLQRYLVYDALKAELVPLKVTANRECPVCSAENGVLGLGDMEPLPDYRRQPLTLPPIREDLPESAPLGEPSGGGKPLQQDSPLILEDVA